MSCVMMLLTCIFGSCSSSCFHLATFRSPESLPLLVDHEEWRCCLTLESGMWARTADHVSELSSSCCSGSITCDINGMHLTWCHCLGAHEPEQCCKTSSNHHASPTKVGREFSPSMRDGNIYRPFLALQHFSRQLTSVHNSSRH